MFAQGWLMARDAEAVDLFVTAMQRLDEVVECYIMLGKAMRCCAPSLPIWKIIAAFNPRI